MFRASQISSEETLPVLGTLTITNTENNVPPTSETKLHSGIIQSSLKYGLTTTLPTIAKHKYPSAVFFILTTKFFEAFAANGMRTILALYLRDDLDFSENFSTIILHIFNFFGQFCPIFGAILADSYLGNIRTISSFCFLYGTGWILLVLTTVPNISLTFLVFISLLFIAVGNGSIRACITSLGALQFKLPEQARQLAEYFSFYYFVYYFGIFLSKLLPPLVRANTQCFNKTDCYTAVFGTLAGSFTASWLIFVAGRFFYKIEKPSEENILLKFYGCIKYALTMKWNKTQKVPKSKYWLHNAIGRYEESFVNDVAKVLRISKLFIPLPIYFALLAQQDSSWTFQAAMMNTTVGSITIQPDQAKSMGPMFLFILIPLWQYILTPLMKRICHCQLTPLKSVTYGGVFSALSFISAGVLEEYIYTQPDRSVSILWQIPQFILLMLGELLLSIPGLQFAFTQAPTSMKSVVTAAWFLNNAFGNLIVVIITQINIFDSQSKEYFFYAVLMLVSIIIFTLMAYSYMLHERLGSFYSNSDLAVSAASIINDTFNEKDNIPSTSRTSVTSNNNSNNLIISDSTNQIPI